MFVFCDLCLYTISILIMDFSEIDSDIKMLEDEFDELIVDVATKRRQYPRRILESVIKTLKAQHASLVRRVLFTSLPSVFTTVEN